MYLTLTKKHLLVKLAQLDILDFNIFIRNKNLISMDVLVCPLLDMLKKND